jgi:Tetratricopeptide repeat
MPTTTASNEPLRSSPPNTKGNMPPTKPMSIVSTLISNCLCNGNYHGSFTERKGMGPSTQFLELKGIRFIGLGAVVDELTPRERVYDTLEVFRTKTERLVSIGYLLDNEVVNSGTKKQSLEKIVETVPLGAWVRDFPDERNMSRDVKKTVQLVKQKQFSALAEDLSKQFKWQKKHLHSGINFYLVGITAHSLSVAKILAGDDKGAEALFREAISLKESAFGKDHAEVALSWDELGIQLFARGDFEGASLAFGQAHKLRKEKVGGGDIPHPILAMTLNNIACCEFQMGHYRSALQSLEEARSIQHDAIGSSMQDDLDLLHVAIIYGNCGYLNLALKQYEEARSILEEALLIQQSVLDDDHRAVRDTLSNIEFTNAFHS